MQLSCRLLPKNDIVRRQLVSRLLALGFEPGSDGDVVTLDYDGPCDGKPLAAITVFEDFGCDRVIVSKDWGSREGQNKEESTMLYAKLGGRYTSHQWDE